jgi:transcriptional regulator of acetoin/glycerol metabolism
MERLFAENQTEVIGLRALKEWYQERRSAAEQAGNDYQEVTILPYQQAIPLGLSSHDERIIPAEFIKGNATENFSETGNGKNLGKDDLKRAYQMSGGNITKASEMLGIHKATFYRHLKNLNLSREDLER